MVQSNIKVFLRVRPSVRPSKGVAIKPEEGKVAFELDKTTPDGQVNNTKNTHTFKFDGILPMEVTQQEVFDIVAKPVIDDVLQGINGTIFAYGQTGSGKTFTITGGTERFDDRGLIPRTIAYMFEAFRRGDAQYRLYISYLEIYNNDGYDLLCRDESTQKLEDLPKVQLREDEEGNTKLRNLSVNVAEKVEDALNLLFLGDTNRQVAETPMNDASTRSHCMFILWVDSTHRDSDTVRRAKLHLVDLAGSERIGKTGVEGKLQREATHINLSLHHLETVIVALHERSQGHRTHVPYRNSTMTQVLRDSLGGNCKTIMVGTAASEDANLDESISTCRFAQRVAQIKNNAVVNEEMDPALMIKRLKKEVGELKDELKLLQEEGDDEGELTPEDKEACRKLVSSYLEEPDLEAPFVCGSAARFRECFNLMREVYWHRQQSGAIDVASVGGTQTGGSKGSSAPAPAEGMAGGDLVPGSLEATVHELREQVAHRDNEIQILLGSLGKRNKTREARPGADDGRVFIRAAAPAATAARNAFSEDSAPCASPPVPGATARQQHSNVSTSPAPSPPPPPAGSWAAARDTAGASTSERSPTAAPPASVPAAPASNGDVALLLDRNKAFEVFRKSHRRCEIQEENQKAVAALVAEAKSLGERANAARQAVISCKGKVEKMRTGRVMESSPCHKGAESKVADGPEVAAMLADMEEQKRVYQKSTQRLTELKAQIEEYQRAAAQNKQRLQRDFEAWLRSYQASHGMAVPEEDSPSPEPSYRDAPLTATSVSSGSGGTALPLGGPIPAPAAGQTASARGSLATHAGNSIAVPGSGTGARNGSTPPPLGRQSFQTAPSPAPNGCCSPTTRGSGGAAPGAGVSNAGQGLSSERTLRRPGSRTSLTAAAAVSLAPSPSHRAPSPAPQLSQPHRAPSPPAAHCMRSPAAGASPVVAVPAAPAPAGSSPPAGALTGDAEVDEDIAAYYAAIAELTR